MSEDRLRAYIPPEVAERFSEAATSMWSTGMVAKLLVMTGIPVIKTETIPTICYRINMINQSVVQEKIAMGMHMDEVVIPDIITPDLLMQFTDAAISGGGSVMLSDDAFIKKLVSSLKTLPKADAISIGMSQIALMRRSDEELSAGG